MKPITTGTVVSQQRLQSIQGTKVDIPHSSRLTHLQFRRFAGCPICNMHAHEISERHKELVEHGIQEVLVFESSEKDIAGRFTDFPFPLISDPNRTLYNLFGVGKSALASLNPKMLPTTIKGLKRFGVKLPESFMASFNLPAEFLIDTSGRVTAAKYGKHFDDQWNVDEILRLTDTEAHDEHHGHATVT